VCYRKTKTVITNIIRQTSALRVYTNLTKPLFTPDTESQQGVTQPQPPSTIIPNFHSPSANRPHDKTISSHSKPNHTSPPCPPPPPPTQSPTTHPHLALLPLASAQSICQGLIQGDMLGCTTRVLALSPDCRADALSVECMCDSALATVSCLKNWFGILGKLLTDALGVACRRIFRLCAAEG